MFAVFVTQDMMRASAKLAERYDCGLHTRLAETEAKPPTARRILIADPGCWQMLDGCNRAWLAHGIHFTPEDVPWTAWGWYLPLPNLQRRLASGCPTAGGTGGRPGGTWGGRLRFQRLVQHDGGIRHALMINRALSGCGNVGHLDALRWATAGSAACLARDDIGTIAAGKGPISRCSSWTTCASLAHTIRWLRWSCAARITRTASW